MKKLKKIPEFKSEAEERKFWASHDSSEYVNWKKSKRIIFPDLKPTSNAIGDGVNRGRSQLVR